jgi:hypothetical protein
MAFDFGEHPAGHLVMDAGVSQLWPCLGVFRAEYSFFGGGLMESWIVLVICVKYI